MKNHKRICTCFANNNANNTAYWYFETFPNHQLYNHIYGWVGGLALGWIVRDSPIIERNVTF